MNAKMDAPARRPCGRRAATYTDGHGRVNVKRTPKGAKPA
ncbi:hypothetical protein HMPREF0185_00540 [Brevundimonas diminuta 470-4]|nr:hypothetical protein HMPREF0185_00540 [Brevundimonas diminuta 470-4]